MVRIEKIFVFFILVIISIGIGFIVISNSNKIYTQSQNSYLYTIKDSSKDGTLAVSQEEDIKDFEPSLIPDKTEVLCSGENNCESHINISDIASSIVLDPSKLSVDFGELGPSNYQLLFPIGNGKYVPAKDLSAYSFNPFRIYDIILNGTLSPNRVVEWSLQIGNTLLDPTWISGSDSLNLTYQNQSSFTLSSAQNDRDIIVKNTSQTIQFLTQSPLRTDTTPSPRFMANIFNNTISRVTNIAASGNPGNISSTVIEFDSGISVQRGNLTIPVGGYEAVVNLTSAVNVSRAFVIMYSSSNFSANGGGGARDFHQWGSGNFTNSTTLHFARNSSVGRLIIEWQAIEFYDNTTVQSGVSVFSGTGDKYNVTINDVNLTKAFIIFSANFSAAPNSGRAYLRANLTSTTTLQFSQNITNSNDSFSISWFVVNMSHENASVQLVDTYIPGGVFVADFNISSVNVSRSVIIGSTLSTLGNGHTGDTNFAANFTNATSFELTRGGALGNNSGTWYVIQFPFTDNTAAANTCTPTANADWTITCSDNCIVTGTVTSVNNINTTGIGNVILQHSNITYGNFSKNYQCNWSYSYDSIFKRRT